MTLKEKLCEPFGVLKTETANELVEIVDEFAIGFAELLNKSGYIIELIKGSRATNKILEIYKKEKKL
jgi:dissimilatory sulfite reductase (desulfoviridin) alpha/beta subunit